MSTTNVGAAVLTGSQTNTSDGGLGAGIDVSQLVSAALANQDAGLQLLQNQQSAVTSEQSALSTISTDLGTLQTAAFALTDPLGQLTDIAATSSNDSVVTASAEPGAPNGTHTVVVNNLATTSSEYSAPVASSSTPIATGTLTIQVGTNTAVPVTINSSNNTLAGLAQTINNANIGVAASVINDASGARLAIVSNTSGTPGDLTITDSTGLPAFTKAVTGVNASVTVDGIPISSTTNSISSAIDGVTLNLASQAPGTPVTITISPDVNQQTTAINNFVSAYNTVIGDLNAQFAVNPQTGQPGPLQADSTLALAQNQILSAIAFSTTGNGAVNSLADLGISLNDDGTLSVDSATLATALQSNPSAVQTFFAGTTAGSFGANLTNALAAIADPVSGSVAQDSNGLAQTQTDLTQQISDFQDQLSAQQQQLTAEYNQVDVTLQELPLLLQQVNQQLTSLG
jgi:flagellar hook-associated protein 2